MNFIDIAQNSAFEFVASKVIDIVLIVTLRISEKELLFYVKFKQFIQLISLKNTIFPVSQFLVHN